MFDDFDYPTDADWENYIATFPYEGPPEDDDPPPADSAGTPGTPVSA